MQVLVVGAGVVGLAVARAVALAGHEVIVAEAAAGIGTGVSSRNSEVIHAGLYYPTGSKRAYHCVRGRRMLYDFCASHGVPHRKCGKLVVATNEARPSGSTASSSRPRSTASKASRSSTARPRRRLEPALACVAAMCSPETGIIDSHRYMLALEGELEDHGGVMAFNTPIERLVQVSDGWEAHFGGADPQSITVDAVVNSAGLGAQTPRQGDRRLSAGAGAAARARQGQLFRLRRPAGVLAADLSGADPRRARRACDARPGRAHALRPRRRVDRATRTTMSMRRARRRSTIASATIGRACRITGWFPIMPGSGRS